MTSDLHHELSALSSIYTPTTLVTAPPDPTLFVLTLPSQPVSLRLSIPASYPAIPPAILGTEHIGAGLQKGYGNYVIDIARSVVKRVWREGAVCLFDLVEELESALSPAEEVGEEEEGEDAPSITDGEEEHGDNHDAGEGVPDHHNGGRPPNRSDAHAPAWVASSVVEVKKSVFVARAAKVASPAMAKDYIAHLLATDKKAAKATHTISAYRIRSSLPSPSPIPDNPPDKTGKLNPAITFQDCDSDGEDAAGGRLLHLLQAMGVWDVLVVVCRWYGGVKLGPDRFRVINSVAREAVVRRGRGKGEEEGKKRGKG
ncbi:MAG: hypothetical protein FRX48_07081 [Lasallia pustulata]|uniref:RWD domain-containing protein n=1 Tax=Lasallia pustulata TaxID=136370 RepID=A0A5M8PID0_9LECA|nr:MAG: hypothetical protein FRX48_07081 [Lasallia pustulata]